MPANFKVIINYSEDDNNPGIESGKGWVDNFNRFLGLMLHQVIGSKPEIIMRSGGEDSPEGEMESVDAMVCIISTSFIGNGKCLDALEDFFQRTRAGESEIQRIFKIMKSALRIQDQPVRLRELMGYDMFHYDEENEETKEFQTYFGDDSEREFWMKMVDIVYDLHETHLASQGLDDSSMVRPIQDRKTVYLAETGHDMTIQRNIIKRELQRYGFRVLPSRALPPSTQEIDEQVRKALDESSLAIHLIGTAYGDIPDGSQQSVVDIQNQLAAEWSRTKREKSKLKNETYRFIWIAPNLRAASEKQLAFIENVKRDIAALEGAEILQTPLEDFKNIIREELFSGGKRTSGIYQDIEDSGGDGQNVYLIHDKVDQESVASLKKEIEQMGYTVLEPTFQGELLDMREGHIQNLRRFDFALVYQGLVNDQWVRMKLLDLMKAPGFGRTKPILNKGVIIGKHSKGKFENVNDDKQVEIIHEGKSSSADLQKFLQTRQQVL